MTVWIIARLSYERVSGSERLERDRQTFESSPPSVRILFVGFDEKGSLQKRGREKRQLLASTLDDAACMKKRED